MVRSVQYDQLKELEDTPRGTLQTIMQWVQHSPIYQRITEHPLATTGKQPRVTLSTRDLQRLEECGKLRRVEDEQNTASTPHKHFCNAFTTLETKEDGDRRRPIFEPHINQLLHDNEVTVSYTPKSVIHRAVAQNAGARQLDMAAWFDQLPLAEAIQQWFTVCAHGISYVLTVIPMGYRPACVVAQGIVDCLIHPISRQLDTASCVDNVIFFGDETTTASAVQTFLTRCKMIGAQVKDDNPRYETSYDFLGEHYTHGPAPSKRLTEKTWRKILFLSTWLADNTKRPKTRQLMAVFGLLLYASQVLDLSVASHHFSMKFLSFIATQDLQTRHTIPDDIQHDLSKWTQEAVANTPVPVYTHVSAPTLTIYVDASSTGWGALAIEGASVRSVARPWGPHEEPLAGSSVFAEPAAVRRAVAFFVAPARHHSVQIWTDHQPLVFAWDKGHGHAFTYSHMIVYLQSYKTQFTITHIPGHMNPADALSRINHSLPPLLQVTKVGYDLNTSEREKQGGQWQMGRAAKEAGFFPHITQKTMN